MTRTRTDTATRDDDCRTCLLLLSDSDSISVMNSRHRRTLEALFAEPINGNLEWRHIEALFRARGCNARTFLRRIGAAPKLAS